MKKVLAAVFAVVTAVSLTGCSMLKREKPRSESSSSSASSSASTSSTQSGESSEDNSSVFEENGSSDNLEESSESSPTTEESSSSEENSSEEGGIIDSIVDGLSFESIYDDYSKQIEDTAEECINEINANKGNIDTLADISADGIDKMAELCAEGIDKMADRVLLNASGYMEWSTKLSTLYTTKSSEVTSAYMSASVEGAFSGLDFDFDF